MDDSKDPIFRLCDLIRETAYAIHRYHRHGHSEKIYENALANRLPKQGIKVSQQARVLVRDEDGTALGELIADMLAEDVLILEIKSCKALTDDHTAQVLGYLRATGIQHALLINFGAPKLQIKKLVWTDLNRDPEITRVED